MPRKLIIAIDGLSSSGKSTLAKHLAETLQYEYIDSGAFYRAITLFFYEQGINWANESELSSALGNIGITFKYDPVEKKTQTYLNGRNVEPEIRGMKISNLVSAISTLPAVRSFIVSKLQEYGGSGGLIMDGRDIGTVVFPTADLKIYMKADEKIRSERRFNEMKSRGVDVTESQISQNLSGRDHTDSTRLTNPLKIADDAVVLDNSHMTEEEQFQYVLRLANQKMNM